MKTTYKVIVTRVEQDTATSVFKTLQDALDAAFLVFCLADFEKRYENCKYLESMLKQRNCPRAHVERYNEWSVGIVKQKGLI